MNSDFVAVKREKITPFFREQILKRDLYSCRYCGSKKEPFHLDHVYPVSKGGETSTNNIVTSCVRCNAKKHNRVGMFPKPIGYFKNEKFRRFYLFSSSVILGALTSILFLLSLVETNGAMQIFEMTIGFICFAPIIKELIERGA